MAWYLILDDVDDYMDLDSAIGRTDTSWKLKFKGVRVNDGLGTQTYYLMSDGTANNWIRINEASGDATMIFRKSSVSTTLRGTPPGGWDIQNLHEYSVEYNGTTLTFKIDGTTVDTAVIASQDCSAIDQIGRSGQRAGFDCYGIAYYSDTTETSKEFDWDTDASSHASGTPVLTETVTGNNATGVNMPTDGSAWVNEGASAVTATIAVTVSKPTVAISSSATLPQPEATVSVSVSKPAVSISGSSTLPQPDAAISVSVSKPTVSFSGSATLPNPSASIAVTVNKPAVAISSSATLPQPDAAISVTVSKPTVAIEASATTSQPNANISVTVSKPAVLISGSATLPQPDASVSVTANKPTVNASASVTLPEWNATVAVTVNKPVVSVSASATVPQPDATIAIVANKPTVSVSATVSGIVITVASGATVEIPDEDNTITLSALDNSVTIT